MKKIYLLLCLPFIISSSYGQTDQTGSFGIRAGIGTDISLGIAYGAGFNYRLQENMELGLVLFGGKFSESTEEGIHIYDETTQIFAIGAQANWLFSHRPDETKPFFIAGTGLTFISSEYEQSSTTDTSLGASLPGGGSVQFEDGSTGGAIFTIALALPLAARSICVSKYQ